MANRRLSVDPYCAEVALEGRHQIWRNQGSFGGGGNLHDGTQSDRDDRRGASAIAARRPLVPAGERHAGAQSIAAAKELSELPRQDQEIEAQIRAARPRHASLTQPQPLSVAEIQRQVLDADTLRILLSPAASQLGAKRLLVVAPGMLEYLPFAVLPIPKVPNAKDREGGKTAFCGCIRSITCG